MTIRELFTEFAKELQIPIQEFHTNPGLSDGTGDWPDNGQSRPVSDRRLPGAEGGVGADYQNQRADGKSIL